MAFDSIHVSRLVYEYLIDNGYPFAADAFANECSELMALKYQLDQHSAESIPPLVGPSLVDMLENYSYTQSKQLKCSDTTYPTSLNSDISQSCDSAIVCTGQLKSPSCSSKSTSFNRKSIRKKNSYFTFNNQQRIKMETQSVSSSDTILRPHKLSANRSPFHRFSTSSSENSFTIKNEHSSEKTHGYSSPVHTAEAAENPQTRTRLKIRNNRSKEQKPPKKNQAQPYDIRPCSVVLRRVIQLYVPRGVFQLSN